MNPGTPEATIAEPDAMGAAPSAEQPETPAQELARMAVEAQPRKVNGQWEGAPIANFPHLQEMVRRGLEDGTLEIGGQPQQPEKDQLATPCGQAAQETDAAASALRALALSDVDPVVLAAWKLQGRKVGAMLADAQAAVIELQEELDEARAASSSQAAPSPDAAQRLVDECRPYLKDSETPAQCIERNRKDASALLSYYSDAIRYRWLMMSASIETLSDAYHKVPCKGISILRPMPDQQRELTNPNWPGPWDWRSAVDVAIDAAMKTAPVQPGAAPAVGQADKGALF
jgi:hypothetical protein